MTYQKVITMTAATYSTALSPCKVQALPTTHSQTFTKSLLLKMPNKSSIFGVQKSSDQDLTYIINTLKALLEQFIVVRGDGLLGLTGGKGA